jgi:hypothetical protein
MGVFWSSSGSLLESRRGAEGTQKGMVEWIGNGIYDRVSKVFWRAEGEEKERRMKTESGNRTESENRILAENVFCENYRKCSDGQKVRRGAEG